MKNLLHGIEYLVSLFFFLLVRLLPLFCRQAFTRHLARLALAFTPGRKQIALDNLHRAFPEFDEERRQQIVKQVYLNLAGNAVDSALAARMVGQVKVINGNRFAEIKNICVHKQPVLFASGHFGNWELLATFLASQLPSIHFLAKAQSNRLVDRLINRQRIKLGGSIIPSHKAPRLVPKLLKQGASLLFVGDQDGGSDGIMIDFFGLPTSYARGLALYSYHYNVPIAICFMLRNNPGYSFYLDYLIYPNPDNDRNSEVRRLLEIYSDSLEKMIRQTPQQWLWTHRRWKSSPADDNSIY